MKRGRAYGFVWAWALGVIALLPAKGSGQGADTESPTAPAALTGTATSTSQIDLAWNASTDNVGVAGYRVYRNGTEVGTTAAATFPDAVGLVPMTKYIYTVVAFDAAGNTSAPAQGIIRYTLRPPTQDYFDWGTRLDRYGKPAGYFVETPFPLDEVTTSYAIRSDEYPLGRVYELGGKLYVDGARPNDAGDGLSLATAKRTIAAAIAAASSPSNTTILIRGAHDGFDGRYPEVGLRLRSGLDDTHRFMLSGYRHERPVINGVSTTTDTVGAENGCAYATIQRVMIRDTFRNGIRTGVNHSFINVIDVWLYNNDRYNPDTGRPGADGNLYFLGSTDCWIFHTTSEHTYGHGFKLGDGASNLVIEWSRAYETGYWDGFPLTSYFNASSTGIDLPNGSPDDSNGDGYLDLGQNNVIRYNIVDTALYLGVQVRRNLAFVMHHNEVLNSCRFDDVDMSVKGVNRYQVCIVERENYGEVYANVLRDPGAKDTANLAVSSCNGSLPHTLTIHNNLIYGGVRSVGALPYGGVEATGVVVAGNVNVTVNVFNNTFYSTANTNLVLSPQSKPVGGALILRNNIFAKSGTGSTVSFNGMADWATHTHNLYFAPNGSIGIALGGTELNADPLWHVVPSGPYASPSAALQATSPARDIGADLGAQVRADFARVLRPQGPAWDIGALEYAPVLPGGFVPLPPCRVLDTRVGSGASAAAPALAAHERRVFAVGGACGVPANAQAISANLTVVSAQALGDLRVAGGHVTSTITSALSIPLARARANNAIVQLSTSSDGTIAVTNDSSGEAHFILDVNGYFQ
jgi:hypothetical protein